MARQRHRQHKRSDTRPVKVEAAACEPVRVKIETVDNNRALAWQDGLVDGTESVHVSDIAVVKEMDVRRDALRQKRPRSRSHPLADSSSQEGVNGDVFSSGTTAKKLKRDRIPDFTHTIVDCDLREPVIPQSVDEFDRRELLSTFQAIKHRPVIPKRAISTLMSSAGPQATLANTDEPRAWLLDAAVNLQAGMVVVVHGSRTLPHGAAWHGGDYEGAHGVVLSVHNTGSDDEFFPSTARIKFLKPLSPSINTFAVPVSILWPVRPQTEGEQALIIGGEFKGHRAKLLEEVSEGWFVSAAYDYFEVTHENLVRMLPV